MPEYLVFAKTATGQVTTNHVNAVDIATAQTVVTNNIYQYSGWRDPNNPGVVLVGIVALGAAFSVTPP